MFYILYTVHALFRRPPRGRLRQVANILGVHYHGGGGAVAGDGGDDLGGDGGGAYLDGGDGVGDGEIGAGYAGDGYGRGVLGAGPGRGGYAGGGNRLPGEGRPPSVEWAAAPAGGARRVRAKCGLLAWACGESEGEWEVQTETERERERERARERESRDGFGGKPCADEVAARDAGFKCGVFPCTWGPGARAGSEGGRRGSAVGAVLGK